MKTLLFQYESSVGTFWIHPEPAGRVQLRIDGKRLKTYGSAKAAARDVATHSTGWEAWDKLHDVKAPSILSKWKRGAPSSVPKGRSSKWNDAHFVRDFSQDDVNP